MKYPLPLLALAALLGLSQCKKHDPDPLEQLPPATQTGANTFGCLVNGKPWTPQGYNGSSNYSVDCDPNYRKGILNIQCYRYYEGIKNADYLTINSDSLRAIGTYILTKNGHQDVRFTSGTTGCDFTGHTYYRRGVLTITRFDIQAGIISGTFDFTLYKPGCDTIRVTQGRFDKQL